MRNMVYEVYLKSKTGDLSREAFFETFLRRDNCCIEEGDEDVIVYKNPDTGVGFYFEYMHEDGKGEPNVRPDGVYRVAVCVEYCQPTCFFIEALYEIVDLVKNEGFSVYDPQIGGPEGGGEFSDEKLYDSWNKCNARAVRDYMMPLGREMENVPMMPYETLKTMWRWNYSIPHLKEALGDGVQIPSMQCIELDGDDLTAVFWRDGGAAALPYVDVIIIARRKKGADCTSSDEADYELCAIDYEDAKALIEKYSKELFANAFILGYTDVPEEISRFMADLKAGGDFMLMDMCDFLEHEVVQEALLLELKDKGDGEKAV